MLWSVAIIYQVMLTVHCVRLNQLSFWGPFVSVKLFQLPEIVVTLQSDIHNVA